MSLFTSPETSTEPQPASTPAPRAEPVLTPVLSARWALKVEHLLLTLVLGGLLVLLSYLPLRATDLWGHVIYGNTILDHGTLPTADPQMPLAAGMRVVDTAWLSQVIFATVERAGGAVWLSNLFALVVWLTYLVLARVCYRQTGRVWLATAGVLLALAVGWSRLTTIRPENFALLGFTLLLWLVVGYRYARPGVEAGDPMDRPRYPWGLAWGAIVCLGLWANLHGSFACGWAVLACCWLGRVIETAWSTGSLTTALFDRAARRWLVLLECCLVVTLLNPYGLDLWFEALGFVGNPVLRDVSEWAPLVLTGVGGAGFAIGMVALAATLRHGRRQLPAWEVLMLLIFIAAACWQVRFMGWLSVVLAVVLAPQWHDIVSRWFPVTAGETPEVANSHALPPGRSWSYTLACVAVAWCSFALSGLSAPLLGATERSLQGLYGAATPLALSAWLREHPTEGQAFNPQWWGDWLCWDGPPGFQPFVTTHMHLVPRQVWIDYRRISMAEPGWDAALDRYAVQTVIIDRQAQPLLVQVMRRNTGWQLRYEDEQAQVYSRRRAASPAVPTSHQVTPPEVSE